MIWISERYRAAGSLATLHQNNPRLGLLATPLPVEHLQQLLECVAQINFAISAICVFIAQGLSPPSGTCTYASSEARDHLAEFGL